MRRLLWIAVLLALLGGAAFYLLTAPRTLEASAIPDHTPDVTNGERMFIAGGCASCHAAPASARCDDPRIAADSELAGGRCLVTPFGTFYAPNISPHPTSGIGGWSDLQFVNAMVRGVAPSGAHYYPAFPYTSYQRMRLEDVLDLKAYMDTLPQVESQVPSHALPLPFRLRRGLGLWKLMYARGQQFQPDSALGDLGNRGAYLVEVLGHCGECHTPRNLIGGLIESQKLSGAPAPEGSGYVPNITPHENGIGSWSEDDIVFSFEIGANPETMRPFGGSMSKVQENIAKLEAEDRKAIAAYLKSVPALPGRRPSR